MSKLADLSLAHKVPAADVGWPLAYVDRRLLNPDPLLPAVRSQDGTTATYACPWCGKRHRHHVRPHQRIYAKHPHCPVFRRLFPDHWTRNVRFYIEAEISERAVRSYLRLGKFDDELAELGERVAVECPHCHRTHRGSPGSLRLVYGHPRAS